MVKATGNGEIRSVLAPEAPFLHDLRVVAARYRVFKLHYVIIWL
jgi:hypothetical protein